MEVEEYARVAAVEDDHWWYRNTRRLMRDLLAPWLAHDQRILDAGCGPGGNGAWLREHGRVVGVDVSPDALGFVRARRHETVPVRASIDALPFRSRTFDVAVAVTVVTCVPDDGLALRELARVTRPGGAVLLVEPAFRVLRREHDVTVHSLHRYRRRELAGRLEHVGLRVRRSTYAYSFLVAPAAVLGVADRVRSPQVDTTGSDLDRRALDRLFAPLATLERRWLRRHVAPFGTSVAIVATRD